MCMYVCVCVVAKAYANTYKNLRKQTEVYFKLPLLAEGIAKREEE